MTHSFSRFCVYTSRYYEIKLFLSKQLFTSFFLGLFFLCCSRVAVVAAAAAAVCEHKRWELSLSQNMNMEKNKMRKTRGTLFTLIIKYHIKNLWHFIFLPVVITPYFQPPGSQFIFACIAMHTRVCVYVWARASEYRFPKNRLMDRKFSCFIIY